MTRVHFIAEDKTGGGLEAVLRAEANHRRALRGVAPLDFPRKPTSINGNAELLKQCAKYELYRFHYSPRIDHVFYVIDARNAWDLRQLRVQAPSPPYTDSLAPFIAEVRTGMSRLAQGDKPNAEWARSSAGFHAHVLVWERESLLLPVLTQLGLGEPIADVCARRDAADIVKERFKRGATRAYGKGIDGPRYLSQIARDEGLRRVVFESNPYLQDIVEDLTAL